MTPASTAWLTAGEHASEIACWRSSAAGHPHAAATRKLAVCGDLVAMNADGAGLLEIADVIYCRGGPAVRLSAILDRYPGCAVAAMGTASGHLVAPRAAPPLSFPLLAHDDPRLGTLICAMFVHSWLAARWPLAALDPPGLEVTGHGRCLRAMLADPAAPIPVSLYYDGTLAPGL
jgi:hypothetical protein